MSDLGKFTLKTMVEQELLEVRYRESKELLSIINNEYTKNFQTIMKYMDVMEFHDRYTNKK